MGINGHKIDNAETGDSCTIREAIEKKKRKKGCPFKALNIDRTEWVKQVHAIFAGQYSQI